MTVLCFQILQISYNLSSIDYNVIIIFFAGCDHIYCKNCMRGYLEVHIKEGNVSELVCPNIDCKTALNPSQVFKPFKI